MGTGLKFYAGDVYEHNVVLATFPAGQEDGTGSAAALASQVKKFFPNLWFKLLVVVGSQSGTARFGKRREKIAETYITGRISQEIREASGNALDKETGKDGFQLLLRD